MIGKAQQHAAQLGINITVAIVDAGGLLVALERMDGAPPTSRSDPCAMCTAISWRPDRSSR